MVDFQVFTLQNKMYIITAYYFEVNSMGVLFFDDHLRGIGFVPYDSLDFIKQVPNGGNNEKDNLSVLRTQDN